MLEARVRFKLLEVLDSYGHATPHIVYPTGCVAVQKYNIEGSSAEQPRRLKYVVPVKEEEAGSDWRLSRTLECSAGEFTLTNQLIGGTG